MYYLETGKTKGHLLLNSMKTSLLKRIDLRKTEKTGAQSKSLSTSNKTVKRNTDIDRFVDMHQHLEKIEPVFIPGYKLRG